MSSGSRPQPGGLPPGITQVPPPSAPKVIAPLKAATAMHEVTTPAPHAVAKRVPEEHAPQDSMSDTMRRKALSRIMSAVGGMGWPHVVRKPTTQELEAFPATVKEAQALAAAAPGTREARQARYVAFRLLQLLGQPGDAELEFEAHLQDITQNEDAAAACKFLEEEGLREDGDRYFLLAVKRFQRMAGFARELPHVAAIAQARMANVYARLQQDDLAAIAWQKAIELGLPPQEARDAYGYLWRTALSNKRYEEALRQAEAMVALPGSEAQMANDETRLAMVIEKTQGPMKAARLYRQILTKYPERFCASANALLKEIEKKLEGDVLKWSQ